MNKHITEDDMKNMAADLIDCLKDKDSKISISKNENGTDLIIDIKATPFQAAFMASAVGFSNRRIGIAMFGGLLCSLLKDTDNVECLAEIIDNLKEVLDEDELSILGETAVASHIMRTSAVDINRSKKVAENLPTSECFASTTTKTVQ